MTISLQAWASSALSCWRWPRRGARLGVHISARCCFRVWLRGTRPLHWPVAVRMEIRQSGASATRVWHPGPGTRGETHRPGDGDCRDADVTSLDARRVRSLRDPSFDRAPAVPAPKAVARHVIRQRDDAGRTFADVRDNSAALLRRPNPKPLVPAAPQLAWYWPCNWARKINYAACPARLTGTKRALSRCLEQGGIVVRSRLHT
jgi:hypothetical protein